MIHGDRKGNIRLQDFKEFVLHNRMVAQVAGTGDGDEEEDALLRGFDSDNDFFLNHSNPQSNSFNQPQRYQQQSAVRMTRQRPSSAPAGDRTRTAEDPERGDHRGNHRGNPSRGDPNPKRTRDSIEERVRRAFDSPASANSARSLLHSSSSSSKQPSRWSMNRGASSERNGLSGSSSRRSPEEEQQRRLASLAEELGIVEDRVRNAVRQTDMYHFIQVRK